MASQIALVKDGAEERCFSPYLLLAELKKLRLAPRWKYSLDFLLVLAEKAGTLATSPRRLLLFGARKDSHPHAGFSAPRSSKRTETGRSWEPSGRLGGSRRHFRPSPIWPQAALAHEQLSMERPRSIEGERYWGKLATKAAWVGECLGASRRLETRWSGQAGQLWCCFVVSGQATPGHGAFVLGEGTVASSLSLALLCGPNSLPAPECTRPTLRHRGPQLPAAGLERSPASFPVSSAEQPGRGASKAVPAGSARGLRGSRLAGARLPKRLLLVGGPAG